MIIYTIDCDAPEQHFATLAKAVKAAREAQRAAIADGFDDWDIEVSRHEMVPLTKQNILEILNTAGGSWSEHREIVKVIKGRAK